MSTRNPNRVTPGRQPGFTLVEVMLALAVSSIILASIGGIFFSAARLRERTTAMLDDAAPLQQAFSILRRDLRGTLPPGPGLMPLAAGFQSEVMGGGAQENDQLTIFTTTGSPRDGQPWSDIQEVIYSLRDSTQGIGLNRGQDLVRSVYRNLLGTATQEPEDQVLVHNVRSLEFDCFDGVNWLDSWDTTLGQTNLPVAVRVRIQPAMDTAALASSPQPFEMIVPLLTQSRTNQLTADVTGGAR
ncbi:MAG TPA: type II secretion system protein GspJ [Verrucomicrobiae bacterium]|nr:type II secretion system protein GspJ [Verrucomicrobiae bacterium]